MPKALSIALGVLILLTFFGLVAWYTCRHVKRSEDPARLVFKIFLTLGLIAFLGFVSAKELGSGGGSLETPFFIGGLCGVLGILGGIIWAPNIGAMLAKPLTSMFDGGETEIEPQPLYSMAIAKQKARHYREAIELVQGELVKFPTDVTGQLLLAEIQADGMQDLPAADLTITRFCNQPGHAPANIALALNQLADHYLKVGRDAEGARQALEKIVELLPDTPQAHLAEQRLAHLADHDAFEESRAQKIRIEKGPENVGLMKDSSTLRKPEADPVEEAARYVKHLEKHPLDIEAREKLAMIYAGHFQRPDLAMVELESLVAYPNQPAKEVVKWLNLIADIQIERGIDYEIIKQTLERIIDRYPARSYAENARQRIQHLKLQIKGKQEGQKLTLGVYEQNIGLKKNPPGMPPKNPGAPS
jgi:outer membrane protein assembly factor BamD (BamD/ComL family)